jgi:glycosidase/uridine kinase
LINKINNMNQSWQPVPVDFKKLKTGDMPGDKIKIDDTHISRANIIFPYILKEFQSLNEGKFVISVYGGSGVGKSEIGSLLAYYCESEGYETYVLSGDNYVHRIPVENDRERLRIFETQGQEALDEYLGSEQEIDFFKINEIIQFFKSGKSEINLKRMGRKPEEISYEKINFKKIRILLIEWTHGNNPLLSGVDYPVFLYSTPGETLNHRMARGRDEGADSPFIKEVLDLEQKKLIGQIEKSKLTVTKDGKILGNFDQLSNGVMFNAYPDSCGGSLSEMVTLLKSDELKDVFSYSYILPSLFKSDLDRGFSIISYDLNSDMASEKNISDLQEMGISLKLDFVLNHLSVQSPLFQDLIKKGGNSEFIDCFIDWNQYWAGKGELSSQGYIIPEEKYLKKLFMRKPGLPILKIPFPDGSFHFFWNTFYQKVSYTAPEANELQRICDLNEKDGKILSFIIHDALDSGLPLEKIDFKNFTQYRSSILKFMENHCLSFLGQIDLNVESEKVWQFYEQTIKKLNSYGAKIIRLDAFAYLHKQIGQSNFFNEPGTWNILDRIKNLSDKYKMTLLPEIHSTYSDNIHEKLAERGFPIYDFFFPGLVLDALESGENSSLLFWIREIFDKKFTTINMLGSHDGIPVLDVKGILDDRKIEKLITIVKSRGGRIKDLYGPDGKKISYYQINSTFFSALDEDENKLLLARAIQIFMPGIPQVWYLDLFAGKNDYDAADKFGHKEINRTNLSVREITNRMKETVVKDQLKLLKFRNTFPAFGLESKLIIKETSLNELNLSWEGNGCKASLIANLNKSNFEIHYSRADEKSKRLI